MSSPFVNTNVSVNNLHYHDVKRFAFAVYAIFHGYLPKPCHLRRDILLGASAGQLVKASHREHGKSSVRR